MKRKQRIYTCILILFVSISFNLQAQVVPPGVQKDTVETYSKVDSLKYPFSRDKEGSLFLSDPSKQEIVYDTELQKFVIIEKIGNSIIKRPIYMSQEEYKEYRLKKDMLSYFKEKINATNPKRKGSEEAQKDLLPTYYVNSSFFESIFGGNTIEVNPTGSVLVKMGVLYQKVDNPQLSEQNRSSFTFDFDQEISASIQAKVGTRLKVSAQYDTQSTFDFQNQIKLEYTPTEDDILQKVEVGNVSMPLKNSLIVGAQSLFGVKTQLQFGKTTVTGVFAEQKSQTTSVSAEGGSTVEDFEFQASDYDANRHFFLSQYFRDNYNTAMQQFPLINSPINITRVEVWITNSNSTTTDIRNIVAIADLAEGNSDNIGPANVTPVPGSIYPFNEANNISNILTTTNPVREIATVGDGLSPYSMQQGRDYSVLENAIKLSSDAYTIHSQLGYISLNSRLSDSDVLAVSFEYTISGSSEVYRVGEFTSDGITAPNNIVVKLLRSEIISTTIPMWDLMMKNIYSLQTYNMQEDGFRLELMYENDETGVATNVLQNAQSTGVSDKTILNLTSLDRLNQSLIETDEGDGYFDYVEGATVNSAKGYIIFPKVEPFGEDLATKLTSIEDEIYVFNELYEITQSEAKNNYQNKDKYLLKGYLKSESSSGISLGAFNVSQGSVVVTAGGRELVEGVDYVVDYQMGKVQIVNPSLEASNTPINVSVENNSTFNLQTKRFLGVDIEHKFSDNFVAGATFLNLNEKSITQKVIYGEEPINNSIFGLNFAYNNKAPFLTKLVNKLPNIDTDAESNFSIRGDFAYLSPGSPNSIEEDGEATSYIDDFEGSQIPLEIKSIQQWHLASTPQYQSQFDFNGNVSDVSYGYKRAKLAWYIVDPLFYSSSSTKPDNIDNEELSRAEVRRVRYEELFPEQDLDLTQSSIVRTFDLAYYPNERGSYNYDTSNVGADGKFTDPEDRWGGITRALTTTNFEQSNVEYIEFWLMDPYQHYSITNQEGLPVNIDPNNVANQVGELYFNLGNISEDILKDGRKMYENGLPENELDTDFDETIWGRIPSTQSLLYAFGDSDSERLNQDIGFDGLTDEKELELFGSGFGDDPSNDNYTYFRSSDYDNQDASILTRYKKYNNTQGNSPTSSMSPESYPTSATTYPDTEDINKDQTMSSVESYYQYRVSLNQEDLVVGQNKIVDEKIVTVELEDGSEQQTRWLQFRVQINAPDEVINGISGYSSIRFMRMFLTKFKMPVVLRFGEFQLVRGDWRRYTKTLDEATDPSQDLTTEDLQNFEVGVVNIQENDDRSPIPYVLPPGIEREVLMGSTTIQEQDEQSLTLKVTSLEPDETRAIYKNVAVDLNMYKYLKLFLHAEGIQTRDQVNNGELKAIIRLGSDLDDNYYQIEQPLYVSDYTATVDTDVWPPENNIEALLEEFGKLKLERLNEGIASNQLYPIPIEDEEEVYIVRVKGSPNLANIKTIMLGVKNISSNNQSAEVWFNELRTSEFDNEGGWAAVVNADANFADFADVSVTGRMQTQGFGGIEDGVNERSQEDTKSYDLVTNVNLGQLLPKKWGIQLPLNYSVAEEVSDPKYDAQYQDVLSEDAEDINPNSEYSRDYTKRRSISFMNVRKQRNPNNQKKQQFYAVENLSMSYAYNETFHKDYDVQKEIDQNVRATATYNYNFEPKSIEPFKNSTIFDKKYLKFIKDFNINLMPSTISVNSNIYRAYSEQQSRDLVDIGLSPLPELKQRNFMFDWDYNIGYNLTKSLQFNFRASNNYVYDTFEDSEEIEIFDNFFNIGRPDHYHQSLNGTYKVPIDKIPYLNFIKADYAYTADFDWQAASQSYVDLVGNVIQNANTHSWGFDVDFSKFYKNIGLEKLLVKRTKSQKRKDAEAKSKAVPNLRNRVVSARLKKPKTTGAKVARVLYDVVTSVKKARLNYTENNGTYLPGYVPEIGFLGRDSYDGSLAPSLGFVFGSQVDIRQRAIENGWLLSRSDTDPYYSQTYSQTHLNKLDVNITVEPINNLDIQFRGSKTYTKSSTQQLDVVNGVLDNNNIVSEYGNFSISYNMLGSSFKNLDDTFTEFKANRAIIAERLANKNGLPISGYGETSQQVVLPAFLAAYSGSDASGVKLDAFRNIPIPGWQLTYKGFMKMKWFKKHFRSFSVSHSYNSMYSITSFSNNLEYNASTPANVDIAGNYFSKTLFTNVNLIEEFSPLVKFDVKMKNSFSFTGQINTDKALTLNFNNSTITQNKGVEYVLGLGYIIKDLAMNFNFGGEKTKLKGDLTLRADLSLRDDETVIRAIDEDNDQVTGGQRLLSLKFFADYALSRNFTASFYFDQSSSQYAISTTYPRQSVSSGLSVRYVLGN
ncbi:cell surface protein SprA [Lutibacter sp. TH_r2]|uniref:T9SS outer membrane translocon Sov/SprA n=1 Tax=Lutibacter sp. TH_r2 TaxID=3082083 RepID=UPI0029536F15|nr:cell surface protein SprA [Lutibacter sp. TH_r2]MDV7186234.1 cell surface protein SprA [Lutibacter sp. TH_r2]